MNTPKLRFPEFQNLGEWKAKKLGDVAEYLQSGKSKDKDENGAFILYGSTGAIGFCNKFDYQGKNILIARVGANAGFLYAVNGFYCVSDNTLILSLNQQSDYSFFYNLLKHLDLNKLVFGSGQPLITGGQLKALNILLPTLPEQTKIAACLSSLDDLITAQTQKIAALKTHKKGLMQQLFPVEGETVPPESE